MWCCGVLHNFIQLSLNSSSAQIQILLLACRKFVNGENLRQWSRLEKKTKTFRRSTIPQKQFTIHIFIENCRFIYRMSF